MSILIDDLSLRSAKQAVVLMGVGMACQPIAAVPTPTRHARWQRMMIPLCTCGAGYAALIHSATCPVEARPSEPEPNPVSVWSVAGVKPPRKKKRQRVPPPIPSYRFVLQFNFTRPINIALWKKIRAPKGWKKNPTTAPKQDLYRGVRFRCDDLKYALSPEEISLLHMRLLMCLQS